MNTICFVDANNGWACGGNQLVKTINGGLNWNIQSIPATTSISGMQFVDPNIGWFITNETTPYGYIYKTTNGGTSWLLQHQDTSIYYETMFFLNQNIGWILAFQNVLKTTIGGNNWISYDATYPIGGSPSRIRFIDSLSGWISSNTLGSYAIFKSTDGGIHLVCADRREF